MEGYEILKYSFDGAMLLVLTVIAAIDIKVRLISQKLLIILLIISLAAIYISKESSIISGIYAMGIVFFFISSIYFLSKKSIGWGDVKLCSCIAFYFGLERVFSVLFLSIMLCGLWAFLLFATKGMHKHSEVPFAPFVSMGSLLAVLIE